MASKEVCIVCGKPQKAKPLLKCVSCNLPCHMQCTLSKKIGVPVKCIVCYPRATPPIAPSRSSSATAIKRPSVTTASSQHSSSASNSSASGTGPLNNARVSDRGAMQTNNSSAQRLSGFNTSQEEKSIRELDSIIIRSGTMVSAIVDFANKTLSSISEATDVFKSTMTDKLAEIDGKIAAIPVISSDLGNLIGKLSTMEAIMNTQCSKLEELYQVNQSLADENRVLTEKILILEDKITTMVESHSAAKTPSGVMESGILPPPLH